MKHKYAPIGFVYLFGLICASFLSALQCFIALAVLAAAIPVLLLVKKRQYIAYAVTLCAAALAFGLYGAFFIEPARALVGAKAAVSGTVLECELPENDNIRLVISGNAGGVPVKLALYAPDFGARAGDSVSFTAVFSDFRDSAEFSETQYYFSKGIFVRARAADEPVITQKRGISPANALTGFSGYLKGRVKAVLGGEEGGLLCALFFGDRSGLSPYLSVLMKRAGLAHMTAVSGMHLSLIINLAAIFTECISKRRVYLRFAINAALIALLMMFFGMSASVMRSGLMMLIYYSAQPLRRKSSVPHTLGFAAMLITLLRPYACRDMGLWLSVLGTFGVGVVSPQVCRMLIRGQRLANVKKALIASVCAVVCTLPVSAFCFGGVSLVSAFSSLAVYPMFFAALVLMLLTAITGGAFAEILLLPAGLVSRGIMRVAGFFGGLPFSYAQLDGVFIYIAAFSAAGLTAVFLLTRSFRLTARFFAVTVCVFATVFIFRKISGTENIVINICSDGSSALTVIESQTGVSAIAASDSPKLCRELFSRTVGKKAELVCAVGAGSNNLSALGLCEPVLLCFDDDPDAEYDVSGEYTVTVESGAATLNVRGNRIAVLSVNTPTDADIAVLSGYKKERTASGAGVEILCDRRYANGSGINAYYDKVTIIINADGRAMLRQEGGAAA